MTETSERPEKGDAGGHVPEARKRKRPETESETERADRSQQWAVKVELGQSTAWRVIDPTLAEHLAECAHAAWAGQRLRPRPHQQNAFPGSLAASLMRDDMRLLNGNPYVVLPKSDGVRYLLSLFRDADDDTRAVLCDRSGSQLVVELQFRLCGFEGTVLDGELVRLQDRDEGGVVASQAPPRFEFQVFSMHSGMFLTVIRRCLTRWRWRASRFTASRFGDASKRRASSWRTPIGSRRPIRSRSPPRACTTCETATRCCSRARPRVWGTRSTA
ncbi:Hypothetical protein UVM_LOCUS372 [uncultured virus]|nr:Hypothetical protein UVM_LOCUS372 [uncultured virus]